MRMAWCIRSFASISAVLLAIACAPVEADLGSRSAEIVNGTRESGWSSVVLLYSGGGLCTASIISPRVVLTAGHCVRAGGSGGVLAPSNFEVYVGSGAGGGFVNRYFVSEVHVPPGSSGTIGDGRASDVAIVVLASPANETPMEIARTSPGSLVGTEITAIGYGQTPAGGAGTKYRTTARVNGYMGGLIFVEPAVCQGDSGGPMVGSDGRIYGVASFIFSPDGRTEPTCGTAPGAYNEIYRHLDWIDEILTTVGDSCVPSDEICDGLDNNCDEVVDEGCQPLGTGCSDSSTCVGGLCDETRAGRICTQECDPMQPLFGCPPGFYCSLNGCRGLCVPGEVGAGELGDACTADTDCQSLFCSDPGDGMRRCLEPCRIDAGICLAGEVCVPIGDQCGGCIDSSYVRGLPHGLGEPCGSDSECRSGICREDDGIRECVAPCTDGACPAEFECVTGEGDAGAVCVRARDQGVGGGCVDNGDCGGGICASLGDRRWCTAPCTDASSCPAGFSCMPAGGINVCAPDRSLVGEGCSRNEDCVTMICDVANHVCTQFCDAENACAAGFECRRIPGGSAVCERPDHGGGCTVDRGSRRSAASLALTLTAVALVSLRRRRRG